MLEAGLRRPARLRRLMARVTAARAASRAQEDHPSVSLILSTVCWIPRETVSDL